MIVMLTGRVVDREAGAVVIDVQGVGYELGVSQSTLASLPQDSSTEVTLFTRERVRDDVPVLYGFSTREERIIFDKLCAISGVGPRIALAVLSSYTPAQLSEIVADQDTARMTAVPGVGKKTAGRLLLELEGLFATKGALGAVGQQTFEGARRAQEAGVVSEVTEALLGLGYTSQEAEVALEGHREAGATTVEGALAYALRRLGGGI